MSSLQGWLKLSLILLEGCSDGLTAGELQHIDQVLVGDLGELAALIGIEVDVVHIQRCSYQTALAFNAVADGVGVGQGSWSSPSRGCSGVELQVDAHLVVLESDQGERQTRVAAEPELQRDVQSVHRGAAGERPQRSGARRRSSHCRKCCHPGRAGWSAQARCPPSWRNRLLAGLLGELIPDVQPLAILLVDALATDFDLNILDDVVTDPVEPAELGTRAVAGLELHLGESGLQVHTVDQITVALDSAGDLLAEVRGAVERVLNGLHGEVGVAAVHHLEKSNLRVTSQVNILGAIGYELH
jgi:hypothetical protein